MLKMQNIIKKFKNKIEINEENLEKEKIISINSENNEIKKEEVNFKSLEQHNFEKFLENKNMKSLILSGSWGVGKTHFLKENIKELMKENNVVYITPDMISPNENLEDRIVREIIIQNNVNEDISEVEYIKIILFFIFLFFIFLSLILSLISNTNSNILYLYINLTFEKIIIFIKSIINILLLSPNIFSSIASYFMDKYNVDKTIKDKTLEVIKLSKLKITYLNTYKRTIIIFDELERKNKDTNFIKLMSEIFKIKEDYRESEKCDIKIILSLNESGLKYDLKTNFNIILDLLEKYKKDSIKYQIEEIKKIIKYDNDFQNNIDKDLEKIIFENNLKLRELNEDYEKFKEWIDKIADQAITFENKNFIDYKIEKIKKYIEIESKNIVGENFNIENLFERNKENKLILENNIRTINLYKFKLEYYIDLIIKNKNDNYININEYEEILSNILKEDKEKLILYNYENIENEINKHNKLFVKEEYSKISMKEYNSYWSEMKKFEDGYNTLFLNDKKISDPYIFLIENYKNNPSQIYIGSLVSDRSVIVSTALDAKLFNKKENYWLNSLFKLIIIRLEFINKYKKELNYYEELEYLKNSLIRAPERMKPTNAELKKCDFLEHELRFNDRQKQKIKLLINKCMELDFTIEDLINEIEKDNFYKNKNLLDNIKKYINYNISNKELFIEKVFKSNSKKQINFFRELLENDLIKKSDIKDYLNRNVNKNKFNIDIYMENLYDRYQ